jgi:hypothetical protein
MKLRTLLITVGVLAALSLVAFFLRRPPTPQKTDARIGQSLVDSATVDKAAKLRVSDQGKSVLLSRGSDGKWRVNTYYDLPADFSKLSRFTGDLTDAKIDRLVTSNPERISRLEFKDTKLELLDNADKSLWTVTLGKSAESGGRFVRFGDEQKAYLANLQAWIDAESKNWADAQLIDTKPDDVAKIEIPVADGAPVALTRAKKEDAWSAADLGANQKLKTDKAASVLSSLTGLRFSETLDPADPGAAVAKQHLRTFKLTRFDGRTITIAVGRKPEEKKLKPPAPAADGKSGPAALGSVADLAKEKPDEKKGADEKKADDKKPLAPEYETIPAGPVFVFISDSDANAPINSTMQKRAFQVAEYAITSLPQNRGDLIETPAQPSAPVPSATNAGAANSPVASPLPSATPSAGPQPKASATSSSDPAPKP